MNSPAAGGSRSRSSLAFLLCVLLIAAVGCSSSSSTTGPASGSAGITVTKDPTLAAEVPADIAAKGTVIVATDPSYAPNEYFGPDNTTIVGWDVDLGHAIGTVLGLNFNFVQAGFDGIIPGLASGKYDIGMSSFTDNLDREKTVDMVTYYTAGTSFYVSANGGPDIESLSDLCGHSVAVEKGTTQLDDATAQDKKCTSEGKPGVSVSAFPDQNGANLAITSGRAEVGMADSPVAAYQVQLSNAAFKLSGPAYGVAPYGIAVPRPPGSAPGTGPMSKPILDALNELIANGTYQKILESAGVQGGASYGAIKTAVINGATS
jgi:polar amino acid transport system substrate-binding protein